MRISPYVSPAHSETPAASRRLLTAALVGLLGLAAQGCGDDNSEAKTPASGTITHSEVDASMTLAQFTTMCDERGGEVELHPHCGGVNSCKGMSYDETTDVYTEHSCRGLNTCAGYSCVLP